MTTSFRTEEEREADRLDLLKRCYNVWKKNIDCDESRMQLATFDTAYPYQEHYDTNTQTLELPLSGTPARLNESRQQNSEPVGQLKNLAGR